MKKEYLLVRYIKDTIIRDIESSSKLEISYRPLY